MLQSGFFQKKSNFNNIHTDLYTPKNICRGLVEIFSNGGEFQCMEIGILCTWLDLGRPLFQEWKKMVTLIKRQQFK